MHTDIKNTLCKVSLVEQDARDAAEEVVPPGLPKGPRHGPTVGSYGKAVSYERGAPVMLHLHRTPETQLRKRAEIVAAFLFRVISHTVVSKSFSKSQFPHKSVNLLFIQVVGSDKSTDLWWS